MEDRHKAYPTGLEDKTDSELRSMAVSFETPFLQHNLISEEIRRRKEATNGR